MLLQCAPSVTAWSLPSGRPLAGPGGAAPPPPCRFAKQGRRRTFSRAIVAAGLAVALLAAPLAGAAWAEDRSPAQRQTLIDLAYVLGQSHALRQVCAGPADQFWRERMQGLITAEAPDPFFDARLKEAFNTGYASAQAGFPTCSADSRREATKVAAQGRALAAAVAR